MTDIADLTKRISEALERTTASLESLGGEAPDVAALQDALEAEKTANAQLEERVKSIRDKQETLVADLEARVSEMTDALDARDRDLQQVRRVNATLRDTLAQMRTAHEAALPDPHLLNKAMQSELEALRTAAAVDRAELDDVMAALDAIVKEAEHA